MTTAPIPTQTPPPPSYAGAPPSSAEQFSDLLGTMGPIVGLFFVFAIFAILEPRTFLTLDNLQIVLLNTAVVGTAAWERPSSLSPAESTCRWDRTSRCARW